MRPHHRNHLSVTVAAAVLAAVAGCAVADSACACPPVDVVGRGLEPAWWETITTPDPAPPLAGQPSAPVTYTIPADLLFEPDLFAISDGQEAELVALTDELAGASLIVVRGATCARS